MECLQQLLEALEPVVVAAAGDFSQSYEGFSTDTRTVKAGNVFVALSGERFDGHDFVAGAAEAGAVCAIVERKVDAAIAQIVVTDSGLAFGLAAKAWRGALRFRSPSSPAATARPRRPRCLHRSSSRDGAPSACARPKATSTTRLACPRCF